MCVSTTHLADVHAVFYNDKHELNEEAISRPRLNNFIFSCESVPKVPSLYGD